MQAPFASTPEEELELRVVPLLRGAMGGLYAGRFDQALQQMAEAVSVLATATPPPSYRIVWDACGVAGAFLSVEGRLTAEMLAQLDVLGATLDRLLEAAEEAEGSAP